MPRRTCLALPLVVACCGAPLAPPPPEEPTGGGPTTGTPAADVDSVDCEDTVEGLLFARHGTLWFDDGPDVGTGPPGRDDEADVAATWRADERATRSWETVETILSVPEGTFSGVVGDGHGWGAYAVRATAARWCEGDPDCPPDPPDAFGLLDVPDLEFRPLWTAGARLRLVGRIGERFVVLAEETDGARFVVVDRRGEVVARSEPVDPPAELLDPENMDVGLPWVAPLDAERLVLRCGGDELCTVRVDDGAVVVERSGASGGELGWSPTAGAVRVWGWTECAALGGDASEWVGLEPGACPEDLVTACCDGDVGLAAGGELRRGVRLPARRCLVRSAIRLPRLRDPARGRVDADEPAYPGAGIVVLGDNTWDSSRIDLDLLVRGERLALGLTALDSVGGAAVRRDFGVALPPGSVVARPLHAAGRGLWRVRVHADLPFVPGGYHACWLGRLVLRASWTPDDGENMAFANRYWEFGYCE